MIEQKKIGLFFGSFNPIHKGHTNLATYIREILSFQEIWFVVSPQNPLKENDLLCDTLRLRMVEIAIKEDENFYACDVEFDLPKPNYTVETLQFLREKYPDFDFSLIIGADNLQIFKKWYQWETILSHHTLIVYPRDGIDFENLKQIYPQAVFLDKAPQFLISATQIRQHIDEKDFVSKWLHEEVYKFIKNNKLYYK